MAFALDWFGRDARAVIRRLSSSSDRYRVRFGSGLRWIPLTGLSDRYSHLTASENIFESSWATRFALIGRVRLMSR